MKPIRLLLLLLVVFIMTIDSSQKMKEILKKVQKRFKEKELKKINRVRASIRKSLWRTLSEDRKAVVKTENMQQIGQWLVAHHNEVYSEGQFENLVQIFSRAMSATFCGTNRLFNYYQFVNFLTQTRKNYSPWPSGGVASEIKYKQEEAAHNRLNFTMTFQAKSTLGNVVNIGFKILAELNDERLFGWNDFIICDIEVLGDCPDYGKVGGALQSQQELWKKDTEVQKVLRMFSRDAEVIPLLPTQLPHGWLEALEPSEQFSAQICSPEPTAKMVTAEQFKLWYDRLDIMWHPKGELSAQILELKEKESMDVRITMPLYLGWNATQPGYQWNFKIKAVYNTRGDNQWYITMVEALCPPGINIVGEYRYNLPVIAAEHFADRVNDQVQWFSALEFLNVFRGESLELQVCVNTVDGEKFGRVENVAQLEQHMWKDKPWRDGTLDSYGVEVSETVGSESNYLTDFSLHIAVNKAAEKKTKIYFEGTWKFTIEYSDTDMFYYIKKAEFGCMEKKAKNAGCRWKTCDPYGREKKPVGNDYD